MSVSISLRCNRTRSGVSNPMSLSPRAPRSPGAAPAVSGVATLEPFVVPLLIEEETHETYIQILHRRDRTLVAVLELLSPSNKEEPDRSTYLARRNTLLHHDVHVVELDLLLKGQRIPLADAYPAGDYFDLVADATRRPDCDVYAWNLRQPLPSIPIPLRPRTPESGSISPPSSPSPMNAAATPVPSTTPNRQPCPSVAMI